jgi:hypothetical protein
MRHEANNEGHRRRHRDRGLRRSSDRLRRPAAPRRDPVGRPDFAGRRRVDHGRRRLVGHDYVDAEHGRLDLRSINRGNINQGSCFKGRYPDGCPRHCGALDRDTFHVVHVEHAHAY